MAELLAVASCAQGFSHVGSSEVNQGMLEFAGWDPVYHMVLPTFPWWAVQPPQKQPHKHTSRCVPGVVPRPIERTRMNYYRREEHAAARRQFASPWILTGTDTGKSYQVGLKGSGAG